MVWRVIHISLSLVFIFYLDEFGVCAIHSSASEQTQVLAKQVASEVKEQDEADVDFDPFAEFVDGVGVGTELLESTTYEESYLTKLNGSNASSRAIGKSIEAVFGSDAKEFGDAFNSSHDANITGIGADIANSDRFSEMELKGKSMHSGKDSGNHSDQSKRQKREVEMTLETVLGTKEGGREAKKPGKGKKVKKPGKGKKVLGTKEGGREAKKPGKGKKAKEGGREAKKPGKGKKASNAGTLTGASGAKTPAKVANTPAPNSGKSPGKVTTSPAPKASPVAAQGNKAKGAAPKTQKLPAASSPVGGVAAKAKAAGTTPTPGSKVKKPGKGSKGKLPGNPPAIKTRTLKLDIKKVRKAEKMLEQRKKQQAQQLKRLVDSIDSATKMVKQADKLDGNVKTLKAVIANDKKTKSKMTDRIVKLEQDLKAKNTTGAQQKKILAELDRLKEVNKNAKLKAVDQSMYLEANTRKRDQLRARAEAITKMVNKTSADLEREVRGKGKGGTSKKETGKKHKK